MQQFSTIIPQGQHQLPKLPYSYNGLEPIISTDSLHIHHDILHKNYVDNLNKTELKLVEIRKNNEFELIKYYENELAFNGSGHILHSLFWAIMAPVGRGGKPGAQTLNEINNSFGSFTGFVQQFSNAAVKVEGSGWGILAWIPSWQRLEILEAQKHQNITQWGAIPILTVDVWEHSYYLDFKNKRQEYVNSWWTLVNWYEVERRLILAWEGQFPL